jgi:hypothetical protein
MQRPGATQQQRAPGRPRPTRPRPCPRAQQGRAASRRCSSSQTQPCPAGGARHLAFLPPPPRPIAPGPGGLGARWHQQQPRASRGALRLLEPSPPPNPPPPHCAGSAASAAGAQAAPTRTAQQACRACCSCSGRRSAPSTSASSPSRATSWARQSWLRIGVACAFASSRTMTRSACRSCQARPTSAAPAGLLACSPAPPPRCAGRQPGQRRRRAQGCGRGRQDGPRPVPHAPQVGRPPPARAAAGPRGLAAGGPCFPDMQPARTPRAQAQRTRPSGAGSASSTAACC